MPTTASTAIIAQVMTRRRPNSRGRAVWSSSRNTSADRVFTGIVQGLCRVVAVADEPGLRRLQIDLIDLVDSLAPGASVAINGTCLTATSIDRTRVSFDV